MAANLPEKIRKAALAAIKKQMAEHGSCDLVALSEQFPEINRATWYRYLQAVRGEEAVKLAGKLEGGETTVADLVSAAVPAVLAPVAMMGESGILAAQELLREVKEAAQKVMKAACDEKGNVQDAAMLLKASDNLRKTVETASTILLSVVYGVICKGFQRESGHA